MTSILKGKIMDIREYVVLKIVCVFNFLFPWKLFCSKGLQYFLLGLSFLVSSQLKSLENYNYTRYLLNADGIDYYVAKIGKCFVEKPKKKQRG